MPSIKDLVQRIKPFYSLLLVLVIASIFFAIGRLSHIEENRSGIKIDYINATSTASLVSSIHSGESNPIPLEASNPEVIGSKSGKKYYFPWCGTVKRILPENQVHFASIEDARAAGFLPGGNCKGLN